MTEHTRRATAKEGFGVELTATTDTLDKGQGDKTGKEVLGTVAESEIISIRAPKLYNRTKDWV